MTSRRAFLAAAFGTLTARALPLPKVLTITKIDYAAKTVTLEWLPIGPISNKPFRLPFVQESAPMYMRNTAARGAMVPKRKSGHKGGRPLASSTMSSAIPKCA